MKKHGIECEPFFIDIGACDGIHLSNTRYFAELGWGGIFVEPSPHYFPHLEKNYQHRDDIATVNAAIGSYDDMKAEFYFDAAKPDHSHLTEEGGNTIVRQLTAHTMLKELGKLKQGVGVLSIDAEGYDTSILQSITGCCGISPTFIIIESNDMDERRDQIEWLCVTHYLLNVFDVNTIWIEKWAWNNRKIK